MLLRYFAEGILTPYLIKDILVFTSASLNLLLCTRYYKSCYNKSIREMSQKYVAKG